MSRFRIGPLESMLLTSVLAFHPKLASQRVQQHDRQVPRTMYLFALIGMLVGFLVNHHGYLIGLVVFGIGGLFRFRIASMSALSTAQVIFMSLAGLAVGVELPAIAPVATISAWIVIWFFGRREHFVVEVKFSDNASVRTAIETMQAVLGQSGFQLISVSKTKFEPLAEIALTSADPEKLQALETSGIDDRHTD